MLVWPNCVDILVVTLVLITAYRGFHGGLITGILNLAGVIFVTSFVVGYVGLLINLLPNEWKIDPLISAFCLFWLCFVIALLILYQIVKIVGQIVKWEQLSAITQLLGVVIGILRGAWWAGFILLALSSTGISYLKKSVDERSVTAPFVVPPVRGILEQLTEMLPGSSGRSAALLPPLVANNS